MFHLQLSTVDACWWQSRALWGRLLKFRQWHWPLLSVGAAGSELKASPLCPRQTVLAAAGLCPCSWKETAFTSHPQGLHACVWGFFCFLFFLLLERVLGEVGRFMCLPWVKTAHLYCSIIHSLSVRCCRVSIQWWSVGKSEVCPTSQGVQGIWNQSERLFLVFQSSLNSEQFLTVCLYVLSKSERVFMY